MRLALGDYCCNNRDSYSQLSAQDMSQTERAPLLAMAEKRKRSSMLDVVHSLYGSACKSLRRSKSEILCFVVYHTRLVLLLPTKANKNVAGQGLQV